MTNSIERAREKLLSTVRTANAADILADIGTCIGCGEPATSRVGFNNAPLTPACDACTDTIIACQRRDPAARPRLPIADLWPHAVAALKRAQAAATVHDSPAFLLGQIADVFASAGDMLKLGRVDAAIDLLADVAPSPKEDEANAIREWGREWIASVGEPAKIGCGCSYMNCEHAKERAAHPLRVIVAEAAREPKADVVLQALHVSGGAAAVEEISKTAAAQPPLPAFFDCGCSQMKVRGGLCDVYDKNGKPREAAPPPRECGRRSRSTGWALGADGQPRQPNVGPAPTAIPGLVCTACDKPIAVGEVYAGRTGDATHRLCMSSERIAATPIFRVAGATGCGEACPPGLLAVGLPCVKAKGHGWTHRAEVDAENASQWPVRADAEPRTP